LAKLPVKQLTLQVHSLEFPEIVVRTKEEGEVVAYTENVGHEPRNLDKTHPGYKLWTWKTARDGKLSDLLGFTDD